MTATSLGVEFASAAAVLAGILLLVLGILLPFFVWRISVHALRLSRTTERMASDLETVRKEVRAIANATTGTEPPL